MSYKKRYKKAIFILTSYICIYIMYSKMVMGVIFFEDSLPILSRLGEFNMVVIYADSFLKRLFGLMGKNSMPDDTVLVLSPCNSIHTFFMKFSIDAVFLDEENKVIGVENGMKPWRVSKIYKEAKSVAEYKEGDNHLIMGDYFTQ